MMVTRNWLLALPRTIQNEVASCPSCEHARRPRAYVCSYHEGYIAGWHEAPQNGSSGGES